MPASAPGGARLSSAILYAAIVAIWAGVLIPRWLRRDTSSGSAESSDSADAFGDSGTSGEQAADETSAGAGRGFHPPRRRRARLADLRDNDAGERREAPREMTGQRVRAARRRLLGLLATLVAGAAVLAGTRMAAWWVVVPPSVMLLGYLPLLRAAARADAERRMRAGRSRRAGEPVAEDSGELTDPVSYEAHVTPLRGSVPVVSAEVAGGSDVSGVSAVSADESIYDQYTDARLRAVGD
jgi:hypothetical protein